MHADIPCVAPVTEPEPDDPRSDLIATVHNNSRSVIEAELRRLSRRVPWLRSADLEVIDGALQDLSESLILRPLRNAPQDAAPLLQRLFGAVTDDP